MDTPKKERRYRPTLNLERVNRTIQLQMEDEHQRYVNEKIQEMVDTGRFQAWIRQQLKELLPMPEGWTSESEQVEA